jgi:ABC-type multidrug transport system fused ATPase/permease subunit
LIFIIVAQFPQALTTLFETQISFQRILRLLLSEQIETRKQDTNVPFVIEIQNGIFTWNSDTHPHVHSDSNSHSDSHSDSDSDEIIQSNIPNTKSKKINTHFQLKNINIRIDKCSFTAIVGSVGSGKTSLIASILGELTCIDGIIISNMNSIAYCPQIAWILNTTLKGQIQTKK